MSLGFRAWLSMLRRVVPLVAVSTLAGVGLGTLVGDVGDSDVFWAVLPMTEAGSVAICALIAWSYEYDVRSGKCG
jgi:hypothetical protein